MRGVFWIWVDNKNILVILNEVNFDKPWRSAMNKILGFSAQEMRLAIWSPELGEVVADTGSKLYYDEDEFSAQVRVVCGELTWMRYRLRDRSLDGPGWKRTALVDWDYNREVDRFTLGRCAEESVYCLDPRYPLTYRFSEAEASFIKNPFESLPFDNPNEVSLVEWLEQWRGIYVLGQYAPEYLPFPGYFCLQNIPGARNKIAVGVNRFLGAKGYQYISAVPTWWHTANMLRKHFGFSYQDSRDEAKIELIQSRLHATNDDLGRRKASWIVMLAFWAELAETSGFSPEALGANPDFILRDDGGKILTFPLSPERNLWMVHKL